MQNSHCKELAELLFPKIKKTPADWREKYPLRKTTAYRIAPSPTGYVHIGTIGQALVDAALAKKTGGVFYLRIEDTDDKRFVGDAVDNMRATFKRFGIRFDEGAFDGGAYAPYVQSERTEIYHSFAKYMVENGTAYPCFCTTDELAGTREKQQKNNEKTGYYGKYAKCRNLPFGEIKQKIAAGMPWALRADFSKWKENERIKWTDAVKGEMSLPAEINDPVILKSNGIPPYNFAHVVDDSLMGTSTVVRGEEWLVSAAQHIQLAEAFGGHKYTYAHLPTISISDNGNKRKLSKRKDPMALALNLLAEGYPAEAVIEYLLTLYNTDFEMWLLANPDAAVAEFDFKIEKVGTNNPLFDIAKLNDISKNILAKKSCEQIIAQFHEFYNEHKPFNLSADDKTRVEKMLCVERGGVRPRKDLIKFGDVPVLYDYVFDGFRADRKWTDKERKIIAEYTAGYKADDDKDKWFDRIKRSAAANNYALDKKEYKANPEKFAGTTADFVAVIRIFITGRENSPDLWDICRILGEEVIKNRLP